MKVCPSSLRRDVQGLHTVRLWRSPAAPRSPAASWDQGDAFLPQVKMKSRLHLLSALSRGFCQFMGICPRKMIGVFFFSPLLTFLNPSEIMRQVAHDNCGFSLSIQYDYPNLECFPRAQDANLSYRDTSPLSSSGGDRSQAANESH